MSIRVSQAQLATSSAGTPWSEAYGDVYHSVDGALGQARHVFLAGNRLPERWSRRSSFVILETGFGLGLNFLATWAAARSDPARPRRLHFVSVEKQPFSRADLLRAHASWPELEPLSRELCAAWPPALAGFHRLHFDGGRVILTLLLGDARELLPQVEARVDAFYLDGFTPARNPEIWSPEIVREFARLSAPGATLATWTVAGGVRTALADAGFRVAKSGGFGHKREMLTGEFAGAASPDAPKLRQAAIVGAGIAGALCAERLAARGWDLTLIDEREAPSTSAVGLVRPIANARDAMNAKVSRCAFLYALQHLRGSWPEGSPVDWASCGALQLAENDDELARMAAVAASQEYPAEFLAFVDRLEASRIAGREVSRGGWWLPTGSWVAPRSLIDASHARSRERIGRRLEKRVERLEQDGDRWRALDGEGRLLAEAPVMIVANAVDALRLVPGARLRLSSVRGQMTYLPAGSGPVPHCIVSGSGYVAPMSGGGMCVGATYRHDDPDASLRIEDHRENLERAATMLPGLGADIDPAVLAGWTGFRATVPDRLPIIGETALPGLFVATGLGSRGLLWAPLGAELIASRLEGEPSPLPRDYAGAISPRRFLS